ncbi:cysteine desulfurase family protein [Brumimicrobium aurantiacum]|uniref:cysteine desulfurase n=1 Tax=Brumimicrobium aurantiacum TaxID=1737063 RepID=A0A3E1F0C8_9FLAO|nr:cysteine desulfurase family protein [Brumimicrobium aurantiacum]RFC55258.1 cysteine desulfurase [Brumimicrobium aurantiacum]
MKVYLDNAATTPVASEVFEAMVPYLKNEFGNPSSTHSFGRQAKGTIETSRRKIASLINAKPSEIIFTSGGTEADNMAFTVAINQLGVKRVITSEIEHHAVIHTAENICEDKNVEFQLVKLLPNGHVDLDHLQELLEQGDKKTLVSLMHGNNEIGNLLPLKKVSELCRQNGAYFHSDTVQTMAHYKFDMQELDIDFITGAAHKFHGPKGVGFLYIKNEIKGLPFIHGGSQERGLRGGTENLYGIVGLAKAMEIAYEDLEEHQNHVQGLKSHMIAELKKNIEDIHFHGDITPENSLYTVVNVCIPPTPKASMLLFTLDIKGVACSGGSACTSGSAKGSHVLEGIKADTSRPNVRFSFSRYTTKEEVDFAVGILKEALEKELVD